VVLVSLGTFPLLSVLPEPQPQKLNSLGYGGEPQLQPKSSQLCLLCGLCACSVIVLLVCVAATWSVPQANASNFTDEVVTGSLFLSPIPFNLWDIQEILSNDTFGFGPNLLLDPTWQNVRLNSTIVPVSEANIEFGFGLSQAVEAPGDFNLTFTFDIFQDGRALFVLSCQSSISICQGLRELIDAPISATITSDSLVGGNVTFVSGNINNTFLFDATTGNLTFAILPAQQAPGEGPVQEEPVPTPSEERFTLEFKLSKVSTTGLSPHSVTTADSIGQARPPGCQALGVNNFGSTMVTVTCSQHSVGSALRVARCGVSLQC